MSEGVVVPTVDEVTCHTPVMASGDRVSVDIHTLYVHYTSTYTLYIHTVHNVRMLCTYVYVLGARECSCCHSCVVCM